MHRYICTLKFSLINFYAKNAVAAFFLSLLAASVMLTSGCGYPPTNLRTVLPGDALIYLETKDIGKTVEAVTLNSRFADLAESKPDLYALKGIEVAVAITGFETTEQRLTDEDSVLNFQPRFVAAAETGLWNFQVINFTEGELGSFINEVYGGEVTLDISDKHDGKYFVWTARDGRKAYALVIGSVVFFGNDESAIEKCLAVKRGEIDPISKNQKITDGERLAFGYISPDGVAQVANIAGISLALQASDAGEVRSFVSRVLPDILRNSMREVTWQAFATEDGRIEDRYTVSFPPETARVFEETLLPGNIQSGELNKFISSDAVSVTRYGLKDTRLAWRSVLLTSQKLTDGLSGEIIASFSNSLFEPYGIDDGEGFLGAVGQPVFTLRFDAEGERSVVIASVRDPEALKLTIAKELDLTKEPETEGSFQIWRSEENEIAAAFSENILLLGDSESVAKCVKTYGSEAVSPNPSLDQNFITSNAAVVTIGQQGSELLPIANVLSSKPAEKIPTNFTFFTETRFNQNGMERRTISDFGMIGTIIAQFGKDGNLE